jgi:hypothetical protein
MLDLNHTEALRLIAQTTFHPFTNADYQTYGGVESTNPMLGETSDYLIIIDGDLIQFHNMEGDFVSFYLKGM